MKRVSNNIEPFIPQYSLEQASKVNPHNAKFCLESFKILLCVHYDCTVLDVLWT